MDKLKKFNGSWPVFSAVAVVMLLVGIFALQAAEKPERGYLGVSVQGLDSTEREKLGVRNGVEVIAVEKESAAAKAGIKEKDLIQTVNGEKIRDPQDLVDIITELAPEATVKIGLWRDGKGLEVTAALGKGEHREKFAREGKKQSLSFSSGAYLGIVPQELNQDLAPYFNVKSGAGVLIIRVEKDAPAEKAGLKAGDVIVQMGEKMVKDSAAVHEALAALKKGESVTIVVVRHGKKETVKAEPDFNRHQRVIRIYRSGHDLGNEQLEIPDLEIDMPPLPDMTHVEEELQRSHEKLERVKVKIEKYVDEIGEDFWI
jgi:S1-C subfamily serine protease